MASKSDTAWKTAARLAALAEEADDDEERERVVHVVTHAHLEDRQQVWRKALPKPVRAERPDGDGEEHRDRTDARPMH